MPFVFNIGLSVKNNAILAFQRDGSVKDPQPRYYDEIDTMTGRLLTSTRFVIDVIVSSILAEGFELSNLFKWIKCKL